MHDALIDGSEACLELLALAILRDALHLVAAELVAAVEELALLAGQLLRGQLVLCRQPDAVEGVVHDGLHGIRLQLVGALGKDEGRSLLLAPPLALAGCGNLRQIGRRVA